ncbi:MAG TPA: hypothetical protein VJ936_08430, partial [Desulfobacteraceae bacterium]|nr:hypothetical protein [Desulfobacteraceae bacterium]
MTPLRELFTCRPGGIVFSCCFLVLVQCLAGGCFTAEAAEKSIEQLLNPPVQITSRTDAVLDMAVSPDGRHIVYVSGEDNPTTLWLASADPDVVVLPEKLKGGPSVKSSPAISADGRYVAYVDRDVDVKGDICIMDLEDKKAAPMRLTGRETEDGGPCFSSDGRFLYFHQAKGNGVRTLFVIDLEKERPRPMPVNTGGDAMFCAISPDSRKIAFVSARDDASGDLFIFNTGTRTVRRLTSGPAIDMFPRWQENSRTLYFSRIGSDTNGDNQLTPQDNTVIFRMETDQLTPRPHPVTPLNQVSFKPFAAGGRLYFLSSKSGVSNCWALPEEGYIPTARTPEEQLATASAVAGRIPYDPYKTLLAYVRVIETFPDTPKASAKAGYRAAAIFQELNLLGSALDAYQFVRRSYRDTMPQSVLAEIRQTGLEFQMALNSAPPASQQQALLEKTLDRLNTIASRYPGRIAAHARIESVTLLLTTDPGPAVLSRAIERLNRVVADDGATASQKAQALFLQAEIYHRTAGGSQAIETLRHIILHYPKAGKWVDRAVESIIDHLLTNLAYGDQDEKIRKLNLMAIENRDTAPSLAMGALNRIGDLYYQADDLVQAKSAYKNVLDTYRVLTPQTAAARLSLAEILFREEQFRAAIDLYEQEIRLREASDRIYQLARRGYIRKNVSAGEFLFRLGEIPSARSRFKELIDYDDRIVPAHRGYIKCAAVSGETERVLAQYRQKLAADATDPVWLYCTGLCLTYLNREEAVAEAGELIQKAIRFNSSIEYFHQTLGYVHEVLETVYGNPGELERALISFQKAYFLNDHDANPENAANLELNLGNSYYLMGQYGKAFDFYSRRHHREADFSTPKTEIVFYKRYGESAFQNNDIETAISAFTRATASIESHIDPLAPSRAFDRLNSYIKQTIIAPAGMIETTEQLAKKTAKEQSEQNLRAAAVSSKASPPPSPRWLTYRQEMAQLIDDQEAINKRAATLARRYNHAVKEIPGRRQVEDARRNLSSLTRQIRQALDFPERLVELKAEISDRLALAYQENRNWKEAAAMFEQVFSINEKTKKFANLARNRRSVAYNTYQRAIRLTGERRIRLLKTASKEFKEVLSLIELYGVPAPAEKQKQALIDISLSSSLDEMSATQAAKGFSRDQEKRLAETFISRIQLELGNLKLSREELEKQLMAYPSPETVGNKDLFGVSLLYHRAGLLDSGTGDFAGAFENFRFSARLCLKLENPVSAATNVENMAAAGQQVLSRFSEAVLSDSQLHSLQALDKRTTHLLYTHKEITGAERLMAYHNQMGVFYFFAADQRTRPSPSLGHAVATINLQQLAMGHFTRGISLFEEPISRYPRPLVETAARLYLNMAAAVRELGDEDAAALNFKKALELSHAGLFPDLKWRALAGLNRLEQALKVLETVPLSRAGCRSMEIISGFGALVFEKLENNNVDAALNLAEKISELERFNRLAPFVRPQTRGEKAFFTKLYPRLEQIQKLKKELAQAKADRKPFVQQRLDNETALL